MQKLSAVFLFLVLLFALATPVEAQNTLVRVETSLGSFDVELFDSDAPATVANFLKYMRDGDYENSLIHRSVSAFVIQGGGFYHAEGEPNDFPSVPTDPPVVNEPGISNLRGTIAMAKVNGQPNSATSQWFINVEDNTELDTDNGGFTVFGQVVGDGMAVVDLLNSIQAFNFSDPFSSLPLIAARTTTVLASQVLAIRIFELSGFSANRGLTGTWFNGATPGQGWLIDVFEQTGTLTAFTAWFTYDVNDPSTGEADGFASTQHRWLTADGTFTDNVANLTMRLNTGGVFNQSDDTTQTEVGSMTIEFTDCSNALLGWDFDNPLFPDGSVNVVRLSPDAFCQRVLDGEVN